MLYDKNIAKINEIGVPFWHIINLLLILPSTTNSAIDLLYTSKLAPILKRKKDVYYRALSKQEIN